MLTPKSPESEILAKFFADMCEKYGEKMAKIFADFRPSISRKSGRKKFHEKLGTNSAGHEIKFFHRETLGVCGHKACVQVFCVQKTRRFAFAFSSPLSSQGNPDLPLLGGLFSSFSLVF